MASQRPPTFTQSLLVSVSSPLKYQTLLRFPRQAGGIAGTAVDLLFFPIDTVKTRLQSAQGFVRAGGFNGIYKGVGSVIVGSAPGGEVVEYFYNVDSKPFLLVAAVFFVTYDTLKQTLPTPPHLAPVNHMISASIGEVVRISPYPYPGLPPSTYTVAIR